MQLLWINYLYKLYPKINYIVKLNYICKRWRHSTHKWQFDLRWNCSVAYNLTYNFISKIIFLEHSANDFFNLPHSSATRVSKSSWPNINTYKPKKIKNPCTPSSSCFLQKLNNDQRRIPLPFRTILIKSRRCTPRSER